MKIRLGIIGPADSVKKIQEVAKNFAEFALYPFAYEKTEDTAAIIKQHKETVDQWFFSGQAPYAYAIQNELIDEADGVYPTHHGSSLLGKLLKAQFQQAGILRSVSLDTISEEEVQWVKKTYGLERLQFHTFPYPGYVPAEKMIAFHNEQYASGKVEAVFTCIQAVYRHLTAEGIPAFRITPTNVDIQDTLRFLKERGLAVWYRKSQLAIIGMEVFYSQKEMEEYMFSYKMKQRELELKRLLLDYAEEIQGSFVQVGDGMFYIYSTRGEVEVHRWPFELLEKAQLQTKLQLRFVIGFGMTALAAEQHVRLALQYARKHEKPVIIQVDDNKDVTEVFRDAAAYTYGQRRLSEQSNKQLLDVQVSPAIVSKLESLVKHYNKPEVTSQDVAHWLSSTERNARRILTELHRVKLAEMIGEEQSGTRGRPRKIYRLKF
ncbi:hypothetical protein SAMN05421736_101338 [Evansella caseinilytica]|uniref:Transcriptional regulator n=1 Tax=Evansella caseinilytica TaxID=1503961 RepID=A0A1H3H0W3_9BACI|nr:hypothetical protein [Evansella caseinilytica]SDY08970.1 hypothetical protein SAMN05421736_101338 [Evansella caseinilytica]